jgi:hypothetical protein
MNGKDISQSPDIDDLKRRITEAVAAVACDMLRRVWEQLDYRFNICHVTRGAHIECLQGVKITLRVLILVYI